MVILLYFHKPFKSIRKMSPYKTSSAALKLSNHFYLKLPLHNNATNFIYHFNRAAFFCINTCAIALINQYSTGLFVSYYSVRRKIQWKVINRKQSTRWQHLSRLKASVFFSLQKKISLLWNTATYTWDCYCHLMGDRASLHENLYKCEILICFYLLF